MRKDYEIILNLIPENSKVLDIGCSDGELITYLENKGISAQGVELSQEKVIKCLEKGLDVIHGDIILIVEDFPFNQFDYCLLTQTIQAVQEPDQLLNTLKKVSKNIIVSFNNSARLSKISNFLLTGSFDSLLKKANSDHWYNTDYIHPCSIKDFKKLAKDLDLKIISGLIRFLKLSVIPSNFFLIISSYFFDTDFPPNFSKEYKNKHLLLVKKPLFSTSISLIRVLETISLTTVSSFVNFLTKVGIKFLFRVKRFLLTSFSSRSQK